MKREDLQKIEGITKEQIDAIMGLHQTDVEKWNSQLADEKKKTEDANSKISELSEITKKFEGVDVDQLQKDVAEWEEKYQQGMAQKDKEYAKQLYFNGIQFSSDYAKKAIMEEFDSKELEFKDGKFIGADDYINSLKESDPSAFKQQEEPKAKNTSISLGNGKSPSSNEDDGVTAYFKELNPNIKL